MNVEQALVQLKHGTTELLPEAELKQKLERSAKIGRPLRIKLGIDPSAPHLTLGHAVVLRKLRQFQDLGHTAILLVGDFTRLVGDPSDQSSTRPLITKEIIHENMKSYGEQAFKILDPDKTEWRYNSEWLNELGVEGMIQLTSKYTVARILERDDFKKRFRDESPISILEFLYPLLQAYDSVALEADVELGGHDQLFNLLTGRTVQEHYDQEPQIVLTVPLLIGTDGVKSMSQSKNNYIGISEAPQDIFGKIMSLPDEMMEQYYTLLTDVVWDDVKDLHPKECKQKLGRMMVEWFYDEDAAQAAQDQFNQVYARKELPDDMPEVLISSDKLEGGNIWIIALLDEAQLISSRSDGRRLVKGGGVQINGEKIEDENFQVTPAEGMVLKAGKHKFAKLTLGG
jgi:tyrosyl-tRNA synthetase